MKSFLEYLNFGIHNENPSAAVHLSMLQISLSENPALLPKKIKNEQ